jgi:8-oxo-dGTP pyrophosphatase MutT (NUDIX family)
MASAGRSKTRPAHPERSRPERSAGVILFRDDDSAGRLFLLLDYGRYWDYPKGHVEAGEDDATAALRELKEETGITDAQILPGFSHEITYFFRQPRKGLIRKTVIFFLARTATADVIISDEHEGYAWETGVAALARLTYPTAKKAFIAALDHLKSEAKDLGFHPSNTSD